MTIYHRPVPHCADSVIRSAPHSEYWRQELHGQIELKFTLYCLKNQYVVICVSLIRPCLYGATVLSEEQIYTMQFQGQCFKHKDAVPMYAPLVSRATYLIFATSDGMNGSTIATQVLFRKIKKSLVGFSVPQLMREIRWHKLCLLHRAHT